MAFYFPHWTYPDEGPVPEVVDGAEEPELVQEQVGSCDDALIWKGHREHTHIDVFINHVVMLLCLQVN